MSQSVDARTFTNIVNGGVVQGGHGVFFELLFQNGEHESFHCDHDLVPRLIGNLRQYGAMALSVRGGSKAGALEVASPYVVNRVSNSAHSPDGKIIALEMVVTDGFPIQLSMTPDQARETIVLLQQELARSAFPKSDNRN